MVYVLLWNKLTPWVTFLSQLKTQLLWYFFSSKINDLILKESAIVKDTARRSSHQSLGQGRSKKSFFRCLDGTGGGRPTARLACSTSCSWSNFKFRTSKQQISSFEKKTGCEHDYWKDVSYPCFAFFNSKIQIILKKYFCLSVRLSVSVAFIDDGLSFNYSF
jgi:hypothetical protein